MDCKVFVRFGQILAAVWYMFGFGICIGRKVKLNFDNSIFWHTALHWWILLKENPEVQLLILQITY